MNKNCIALLSAVFLIGWATAVGGQYVKDMPYFHQGSNRLNPSGSCQNTCVAMVLKHYGAEDITPDDITARWGTGHAKTKVGLKQVLNTEAQERGLAVRDTVIEDAKIDRVYDLLDQGKPVIVHGRFSVSGHLIVLLGYDEQYVYAHDPAGRWRERLDGGFTDTNDTDIGRYTRYERQAIENALISADHRQQVSLHSLYFVEGALKLTWDSALPDSLEAGSWVELDETITVEGGPDESLSVQADLRAIGGQQAVELPEVSPGRFQLKGRWQAPAANGWRRVEIVARAGSVQEVAKHGFYLLPTQDQVVFADGPGPGWQPGFSINAEIDWAHATTVDRGETAVALEARAFTLEMLPDDPVESGGYRALRFAYHPGDVEYSARPAFTVQLNGDTRKSVNLADPAIAALDLEERGWQTVEVPLRVFYPLEDAIESLRIFGNLRGTFYLDDMRLVRAAAPVPTAVHQTEQGPLPQTTRLGANYPNPFNSGTVIPFSLDRASAVELAVYNSTGQKIAQLARGGYSAGSHVLVWDGRDHQGRAVGSGLYFYRLEVGGVGHSRKLMLLR